MNNIIESEVKIAVDRLGGPTKVANRLNVSNAAVHTWIKNDRVPDIEKAMRLADLAGLPYSHLRRTK
jgi:DNA-binding transcriptional regulator YdaS (Cro superfamily)